MILYNKIEAGKRLSEVISDSGLNSLAFANSIGKDASYLSKMENGKKGISGTYLKDIEEKYKVNRQWLLYGTGDKYVTKVPQETPKMTITGDKDKTIEYLAYSNKSLAENNAELIRMHQELIQKFFSSGKLSSTSGFSKGKGKAFDDGTEEMTSGKKGKRSVLPQKQKGSGAPVGK